MKFLALLLIVCLMALSHCQADLRFSNKDSIPKKRSEAESHLNHVCDSELAAEGSAPWQVSIQNDHGTHICGGAIIDNHFVLTSASCVEELDENEIRVITGTDNWMDQGAVYEVAKIIIHYNFNKPLSYNDLAIIELIREITYDENTQNVTLADFDDVEEGEILAMTGWGRPETEQPLSQYLLKTDYEYISNEDCADKFKVKVDEVDHGHLCGQMKEDGEACHADGGAPLVNSMGDLVGIKIFSISSRLGYPDVFTRVPFYRDWIRTSTKGCWLN